MNFPLYIAKRYLITKSRNNAINFITLIAAVGIIIGSASLFIVLSGFAGLKDFSLQFTTVVDPDLKAIPAKGKSFVISDEELNQLQQSKIIYSFSKVVEEQVIVSYDEKKRMATLKGVDDNFKKVNTVEPILYQGSWFDKGTNQIIVGWKISNDLSIGVLDYGKTIDLFVPKPGTGQITSIKNAFNTVGTINVGVFQVNEDFDNTYIFSNLEMAKELLGYKENQLSALEFKIAKNVNESDALQELKNILGDKVVFKNRLQLNDALYKMLNTENLAVYLIFTLVLIIALFNVIGSIIMMILDKKQSLNTLFNLGATVREIRQIFFLQGSLMSVVGGAVGLGIGFLIILLQKEFSLLMITPSLPYPVSIKPLSFLIVLATISVLGIIASKIASQRIQKDLVEN